MTLDLFNTESHEQMRCGFFHRDDKRTCGFIGVESTLNPTLRGFYSFSDISQVVELRLFLESFEMEWERREKKEETNLTGLNSPDET